jgi:ribokinase
MAAKVAVVGNSNTDMLVQLRALPTPGETVLGGEFGIAAGEKGPIKLSPLRALEPK